MRKLGFRGDTIVEVMVVLAILGLALSISYATANRSLIQTRQAQENAEATEIARGQVEALRTFGCQTSVPGAKQAELVSSDPFCLVSEDGGYVPQAASDSQCTKGTLDYTASIIYQAPNAYT